MSETAWTDAALRALAEGGVAAVRVEALARTLGVTKGSFYHHFRRRDDLLMATLSAWERAATEDIITETDALPPAARLARLITTVFAEHPLHDAIESAIREWAATAPPVQARIAVIDARRLAYVEGLLRDLGQPEDVARMRAGVMYRALIGEFTWRRQGGEALSAAALQQVYEMVTAPWE